MEVEGEMRLKDRMHGRQRPASNRNLENLEPIREGLVMNNHFMRRDRGKTHREREIYIFHRIRIYSPLAHMLTPRSSPPHPNFLFLHWKYT